MRMQIHWQFSDRTEVCAQREINSAEELFRFGEDVKKSHPLPKDAVYLVVPEDSRNFVRMT